MKMNPTLRLAGGLPVLLLAVGLLLGCVPASPASPGLPASTEGTQNQTGAPPSTHASAYPAPTSEEASQETMEPKPTEAAYDPAMQPLVEQARADLAGRLNIEPDQITVLSAEEVVWPDTSYGCPQPGMEYLQVPQDGALIRLGAEGRMYFYHSSGSQAPFFCEWTSSLFPKITPKYDEFVPPPDDEID